MIGSIIAGLSGLKWLIDPIGKITEALANAYAKKQDATTERARIAADEEIKVLEAKRDVLVAESRTPINAIVRAALTAPVGIYLWKVIIWDKVFSMGATDDLSPNLWNFVFIVVAFYFVENVSRIWRRR